MGLDLSHFVPVIKKEDDDEYLDYIEVAELVTTSKYLEQNNDFITEKYFEDGIRQVIYVRQIGYQRKGMSYKFYSDFKNDKIYFDLEDVKSAYEYLEADI
jgi:hypothetical protein